jgi:hypothetical protein
MRWRTLATGGILGLAFVCAGAALSAPGDPKKQLTAAGQAYAKSILLHRGEVPGSGWTRKPTDFTGPNPPCFVKRYSLSGLTVSGEAGFEYSRNGGKTELESDAHVFVTRAQGRRAFAILAKGGLGRCFASYTVSSVGVPARIVKVEGLRLGVAGTASDVFRIVIELGRGSTATRIYLVQATLERGRAVGSLSLLRDRRDWPNTTVRSLAAKMASRMTRG